MGSVNKILLSSVFGPFGVDDAYGRKENVMELFHNQVTREQGLFSLRFNHQSFGLHFIAENILPPTTVLDFPTEAQFVDELRQGYDYVGISFITPNFLKAKRMAELVRLHAPASRIVLGGHGTRIPGVENLIEHDHLCMGEGVRWFRQLLGEDPDRPFRHPILASSQAKRVMGVPLKTDAAVLIPGVGCPNACRFCATSHFFDKTYTPYFDTGRALFDVCVEVERQTGFQEFFVMDENFLKRPERARELLQLMEEHHKLYRFGIFSSAETLASLGAEFLARLGVYFLWIGVESKQEVYTKNRGIDLKAMIRELREHGISVLASGILFLEQHDAQTIWDDIRYVVDLEADFVQFMQLGPLPQTQLYLEYERQGRLRHDIPFEEWHGQHRLWFDHPHFSPADSERLLREAFQFDYDQRGPALLRMCATTLLGYETLIRGPADPYLQARAEELRRQAQYLRPLLPAMRRHAHTPEVRQLVEQVQARFTAVLGPTSLRQWAFAQAITVTAALERWRVATGRNRYQPQLQRTRYRQSSKELGTLPLAGKTLANLLQIRLDAGPGPTRVGLTGTLDRINARALARRLRGHLARTPDPVILELGALTRIEDHALRRLLIRLRRYHARVQVSWEPCRLVQVAEEVMAAGREFRWGRLEPSAGVVQPHP